MRNVSLDLPVEIPLLLGQRDKPVFNLAGCNWCRKLPGLEVFAQQFAGVTRNQGTCPPYWNLERYSDDPSDLSTMPLADFLKAQGEIIAQAVARLRPNRFAVWVIGDVRDADGFFVNLPGLTVEAFEAAGARFYNDAILVTAVGSLPIRVGRQFTAARKLGRTHQNVLVFCKGDPRKATEACGPVEFGEIEAADGEPSVDPEDDQ